MAATTDADQTPRLTMSRMYQTEDWSDLGIVIATKTFRVHKSVVYPANPKLFSLARDQYTGTGGPSFTTLRLVKSQVVMDAMLRHFYELPVEWLGRPSSGASMRDSFFERGAMCIPLIVAAEKYNIEQSGISTLRLLEFCMLSQSLGSLRTIKLGCFFLCLKMGEESLTLVDRGREIVANATHSKMAGNLSDP